MGLCLSSPTLDNRPGRYGQYGYQQGYGYPPTYGQQPYAQQQYAQAQYGVYGSPAGYPPYGGMGGRRPGMGAGGGAALGLGGGLLGGMLLGNALDGGFGHHGGDTTIINNYETVGAPDSTADFGGSSAFQTVSVGQDYGTADFGGTSDFGGFGGGGEDFGGGGGGDFGGVAATGNFPLRH
eukprot:jgi/Botrbrau1/18573/Bobra.0367s0017.1